MDVPLFIDYTFDRALARLSLGSVITNLRWMVIQDEKRSDKHGTVC